MLAQRAVSEDLRWTRAAGNQSAPFLEKERASLEGSLDALADGTASARVTVKTVADPKSMTSIPSYLC